MSEWKEYKLGTVAKVISGFAFKSKDFTKDKGIPAIKIKNIKNGNVDLDDTDFVNESFLSINSRYHLNRNDILVSLTGSHMTQPNSVVGRIALYRHDFTSLLNQRAGKVLPNENQIDKQFLYCFLSQDSIKEKIAMKANGAASQANVSPGDVEDLDILIPPLQTQQKIANILSNYDELIEVNNERIKILEETAQSLYKEWFVRFRFPNYQDTEFIKGVPKGWEHSTIGEVCKVGRGSSPRPISDTKYFEEGTIPWIKIADATASSKFILETREYVNSFGASFSRYLQEGSLIIATSGTLGFCVILGVEGCIHDGWLYVSEYERNIRPAYMFFAINTMTEYLNNLSYGAAIQNVNSDILRKTPMLIPDENVLNLFYALIEPIDGLHKSLLLQNTELRQIRDRLLPRLISGKIVV